MSDKVNQDYIKSRQDALKSRDDAIKMAWNEYKQAKKEAELLQKKAKKEAIDKMAQKFAETTYKAAVKQLEKIRDSVISEAMALCDAIWDQSEEEYRASVGK